MGIVVGIFPDADPQALQQALASQPSVEVSKVRVITDAAPSQAHADALFSFVHVAESQLSNSLSDDMTRGMGIIGDAGGTSVPGMNRGTSLSSFFNGGAANYLTGLGVPDDEANNFNDAIINGRCVVVYSGDAPEGVREAFRGAGLRNIRVY